MRRLTAYDLYALSHVVPMAVLCPLAGRAAMVYTPWAGWTMWALGVASAVLAVDILLGSPMLRRLADRGHARRPKAAR